MKIWKAAVVVVAFAIGFVVSTLAIDAYGATPVQTVCKKGSARIACNVKVPKLTVPTKTPRTSYVMIKTGR